MLHRIARTLLITSACIACLARGAGAEEVIVVTLRVDVKGDNQLLGQVEQGARLTVERRSGDWLLITIPGTQTKGWISAGDVRPAGVSGRPHESPRRIEGWGTIVDPEGHCDVRAQGGTLTITVPEGLHDLWPGRPVPRESFSAPRVLQEIEGDFVMQVKVTADWMPYKSNTNYGAGLLVWDSGTNFLRRERHVFMRNGQATCFSKPLLLQDGKRMDDREYRDAGYYQGRSTWLQVTRTGPLVKSAISHDGRTWIDTGTLTTTFPPKVQVGVHMFKVSPGQFTVMFEDFQLRKIGAGQASSG